MMIILLILITNYLLTVYGYCWEKIVVGHYWDLKGLIIETENGCSMTDFIF